MKTKFSLFCIAMMYTLPGFCQTYIKNVTLVDVTQNKLLPGRTVAITGDIISGIYPATVKIPGNATVINGEGKFLIPGLTDSHVHFFQSGGLYARPDVAVLQKYKSYESEMAWTHQHMEDFLRRYTKAGITTVIDPGATFNYLAQRDSFANKSYAPTIYMAGPLLTTYEPEVYKNLKNDEPFNLFSNTTEATDLLAKQLPHRPDFIKIWYIVLGKNKEEEAKKYQPAIKAIIDEAHKNHLRVAIHATERLTAQLAVESGCDYLVHEVDDEVVSTDFINLLKKNKVVLCPTLIVVDDYFDTFTQKKNFSYEELIQANPEQLGSISDLKHFADTALTNHYKTARAARMRYIATTDSIRMINLKKMTDAGVIIAAGTDAGNIGTQHASSLFTELKAMQQAGMSNWQIIQSATINGAKAMGKEKEFGSIEKGKKADLVLLNANPAEQLENLQEISLVINKGHVIAPDTLIKETPLALVQRQLNAYNQRSIDAFLEPYAEDVELYTFPDKLVSKGKDDMRKHYAAFFERVPSLHCEILDRIVKGNAIVDHESISVGPNKKVDAVAIYHIENNKIKKVYFIQ
ncbi:Imidazolonepropionase [Mucilaginibacter lappiensis]|uniref:Imidazolonepropionase-like amidohydrolase n=1 Tax=Mucilaginibacter lappiensis TaxID=354630 RepID=A0ABR6PEH4_9SPHI|nr:amidohydrolase family protein [Mucilaginibacter lappiensis]MBB6108138.1 imidazolonepropionase-like amidohydrolase [Mucilaginibacter lappiensis]SIQ50499.1 Imidazolonepropionase [Mucilaginibacter lappiensis]